ncbi:hypothetical protein SMMN14_03851 [Sphaerulina musiva]
MEGAADREHGLGRRESLKAKFNFRGHQMKEKTKDVFRRGSNSSKQSLQSLRSFRGDSIFTINNDMSLIEDGPEWGPATIPRTPNRASTITTGSTSKIRREK